MEQKLTTLKASKEELIKRKNRPVFGELKISPPPPAPKAKTCTREQANTFWEMPNKVLWEFIKTEYPDIAKKIEHRVERSKEIAKRIRDMNRYDKSYLRIMREKELLDESDDDIKDSEYDFDDSDYDISDIEADQYND